MKTLKLLAAALLLTYIFTPRALSPTYPIQTANPEKILNIPDFDLHYFLSTVNMPKTSPPDHIKGGIIPHHLVAGYMIADFFHMLSPEPAQRIFILGPNHSGKGPAIITSPASWQTHYGTLHSDTATAARLQEANLAQQEDRILSQEHSITALLPYIKYYLPEASIIPLILHAKLDTGRQNNLATFLSSNIKNGDILVISADFSHFLNFTEASRKDTVTLKALREKDYSLIGNMGNDHLDFPAGAIIFLKVMESLSAENMQVIHHSNSAVILGQDFAETTSYFTIVCH